LGRKKVPHGTTPAIIHKHSSPKNKSERFNAKRKKYTHLFADFGSVFPRGFIIHQKHMFVNRKSENFSIPNNFFVPNRIFFRKKDQNAIRPFTGDRIRCLHFSKYS
jgi:hypothetical protein